MPWNQSVKRQRGEAPYRFLRGSGFCLWVITVMLAAIVK
jgi:hypothetical protein